MAFETKICNGITKSWAIKPETKFVNVTFFCQYLSPNETHAATSFREKYHKLWYSKVNSIPICLMAIQYRFVKVIKRKVQS